MAPWIPLVSKVAARRTFFNGLMRCPVIVAHMALSWSSTFLAPRATCLRCALLKVVILLVPSPGFGVNLSEIYPVSMSESYSSSD